MCTVMHTFQETNTCANMPAKLGGESQGQMEPLAMRRLCLLANALLGVQLMGG